MKQGGKVLESKEKNKSRFSVGGQKGRIRGYKSTLFGIRPLLVALAVVMLINVSARADDLDKLLDWTFFPNEAITFNPSTPSFITISNGGLHLSTVDQSDNVTNSLKGWGFKKGIATFNSIWDVTQQWLTVAQPITLPNGSVTKSASVWADMTGNVLLLHFDVPQVISFPTINISNVSIPVAMLSSVDDSATASSATCIDIPPGYAGQGVVNVLYCPTQIPNVRVGGALRFDGQDDELLVPNPVPNGATALTLEVWVYPYLTQVGAVISQWSTGAANYELGVQPVSGGMAATFKMANNASISGGVMLSNTWNHVVGTFDGSGMVLYVNGVQVASKSVTTQVAPSSQELVIGTSWVNSSKGTAKAANTSSFSGMIDEVAIYTKALSSQDVVDHYVHQASIPLPDGSQQAVPFAGVFDSRFLTVGSPVSWDTLLWTPAAPYGVQLPDNNGSESGFSIGNNTNMSGNVMLLHLNEAFGAQTFADTASSQPNNGVCNVSVFGVATTCPKMGQLGKFDKAATFNGKTDAISRSLPQDQSPTKAITLEAWVYPTSSIIDTNGIGYGIVSKGPQSGSSNAAADFELNLMPLTTATGPGGTKNALNVFFVLSGHTYVDPMPIPNWPKQTKNYLYGSNVPVKNWSHLVGTYDGSTMKLYLNGELQMSQIVSGGDVANSTNPVLIGMRSATTSWTADYCPAPSKICYRNSHFPGKIDEVAIYNRALTQTEVTAHYVRGVVKPKLQIRFCKQADCSDMPFFVGPDLTMDSYFTTPPISTGDIAQKIDLTKLGLPKASTFQYRVLFESPYVSLFPAVSSVSVEPLHFPTTNPSATVNTQKEFAKITSFEDTVVSGGGVDGNGGEVLYQFSSDNKIWFFCSGNYWMNVADVPVDTNDIAQVTSPKVQIQNCLKDVPFSADGGSGTMWFRAYFHSPTGTESIDLNNVKIGYSLPPPPPPPPVDGTPKIANPGDLSTSVGKTLAVVVQASIANNNEITYSIASGEKTGMVIDAKTGLFTWTPTSDQVGNFVVTFRVEDKSDPEKYGDQGVNVSVVSGAAAQVQSFTLGANEGGELKFTLKKPDVSKDYVFTCASGCPSGLSVDYNTGAVVWTPSYSQSGNYDLQFEIAGDDGSTVQPLQIAVKDVDAVPQFEKPGDKVVNSGGTLSLLLTAKDADGGSPSYVLASPKLDGMTLNESTGAFNWVTTPAQAGSYIVIFRAVNNQNPKLYGEQSVVVTVSKSADIAAENLPEPTTPEPPSDTPMTTGTQSTTAQAATQGQATEAAQPTTVSGCSLIR